MIKEITAKELNTENFIDEKVEEIKQVVGEKMAINALSGGVDSSTVTMLGHRALDARESRRDRFAALRPPHWAQDAPEERPILDRDRLDPSLRDHAFSVG